MTAVIAGLKTGRSLIPGPLFAKLVNRIVTDHQLDPERAERVIDQALAFLGTCATTARPLSPTDTVDVGWHTFILHTRDYAAFCASIAGRFIHHVPTDPDDPATHGAPARARIERTVSEIRRAGFVVDDELWQPAGVDCSQCHDGGDPD